eukprot:8072104-Karenia_brevis.AAC.1
MILNVGACVHSGCPFLFSNGYWLDDCIWISAQAWSLPQDALGRRCRNVGPTVRCDELEKAVKRHINLTTKAFRT